MGKKEEYAAIKNIEEQKLMARTEHLILRGVTNIRDVANALGTTTGNVRKWVLAIQQEWKESDRKDADMDRRYRIRQLEMIVRLALNSFERSRSDAETYRITETRCKSCEGKGQVFSKHQSDLDKVVMEECQECNGRGLIETETREIKGQAGDASFLRVAMEGIKECCKLEGLEPIKDGVVMLEKLTEQKDGVMRERVRALYAEADTDKLIKAKALLEELKSGLGNKSIQNGSRAQNKVD